MRFLSVNAVLVVLMTADYGANAMIAGSPTGGRRPILQRRSPTHGMHLSPSSPNSGDGEVDTVRINPNALRIHKLRMLRTPDKALKPSGVPDIIQRYNDLIEAGKTDEKNGLLGVDDDYDLTLFTVLCEKSTGIIDYTDTNKCKIIADEKFEEARLHLVYLLTQAHPILSVDIDARHDESGASGEPKGADSTSPSRLRRALGDELDGPGMILDKLSRLEANSMRDGMSAEGLAQIMSEITRIQIPDEETFSGVKQEKEQLMMQIATLLRGTGPHTPLLRPGYIADARSSANSARTSRDFQDEWNRAKLSDDANYLENISQLRNTIDQSQPFEQKASLLAEIDDYLGLAEQTSILNRKLQDMFRRSSYTADEVSEFKSQFTDLKGRVVFGGAKKVVDGALLDIGQSEIMRQLKSLSDETVATVSNIDSKVSQVRNLKSEAARDLVVGYCDHVLGSLLVKKAELMFEEMKKTVASISDLEGLKRDVAGVEFHGTAVAELNRRRTNLISQIDSQIGLLRQHPDDQADRQGSDAYGSDEFDSYSSEAVEDAKGQSGAESSSENYDDEAFEDEEVLPVEVAQPLPGSAGLISLPPIDLRFLPRAPLSAKNLDGPAEEVPEELAGSGDDSESSSSPGDVDFETSRTQQIQETSPRPMLPPPPESSANEELSKIERDCVQLEKMKNILALKSLYRRLAGISRTGETADISQRRAALSLRIAEQLNKLEYPRLDYATNVGRNIFTSSKSYDRVAEDLIDVGPMLYWHDPKTPSAEQVRDAIFEYFGNTDSHKITSNNFSTLRILFNLARRYKGLKKHQADLLPTNLKEEGIETTCKLLVAIEYSVMVDGCTRPVGV